MARIGISSRRALPSALLFVCLGLFPLIPPSAAADEPPPSSPEALRSLVSEALVRNPEVLSAKAMSEARRAQVGPAGALPDPMLMFSVSNVPVDTFSFSQDEMTSKDIGFTQSFPFPGKRSLQEEVARGDAAQAAWQIEATINRIRFQVKSDWYALLRNREVLRLTEASIAALKEMLSVATSRYSVGETPQQDLFKAQTEILRMDRERIELDRERASLLSDLNALRNRPPDTPVDLPPGGIAGAGSPLPPEEALLGTAREGSPDLRRSEAAVSGREAALRLARRQILPDFQVGGAYMFRSMPGMPDMVTANVSVSLPLWYARKQGQAASAAARELSSERSGYEGAVNTLRNRIRSLRVEIEALRKTLSLYDTGVLPVARESVRSSLTSYQVGKVDFTSVLSGQIDRFRSEIEREQTAAAFYTKMAELESVLGRELP
jgi:cobalt-zinc-cadmium efflux system outer membrane protein